MVVGVALHCNSSLSLALALYPSAMYTSAGERMSKQLFPHVYLYAYIHVHMYAYQYFTRGVYICMPTYMFICKHTSTLPAGFIFVCLHTCSYASIPVLYPPLPLPQRNSRATETAQLLIDSRADLNRAARPSGEGYCSASMMILSSP